MSLFRRRETPEEAQAVLSAEIQRHLAPPLALLNGWLLLLRAATGEYPTEQESRNAIKEVVAAHSRWAAYPIYGDHWLTPEAKSLYDKLGDLTKECHKREVQAEARRLELS